LLKFALLLTLDDRMVNPYNG
jgi:hypothetical protein